MHIAEIIQNNFKNPPLEFRPMKIIHGIPPDKADTGMQYYKDIGLGGVVCNVAFENYMCSEQGWEILADGIKSLSKLNMKVWLYDEEGYPSGSAGGQVLKINHLFESMEVAYDNNSDKKFIIRPAYEFTHATNNFYAFRRYINLLDFGATGCFIGTTHEKYFNKLKEYFGNTIEAIFTDEPSLMAINLGKLPIDVYDKIRVVDPINPEIHPLPCIPWSEDVKLNYKNKYNEDIEYSYDSLFIGDSDADKINRSRFWELISEMVYSNFFSQIKNWCNSHNIFFTGHTLYEEQILNHTALYGNSLKSLSGMDIPGFDMLSSNPNDVIKYGWLTAGLPLSAALLTGKRRVMVEISDFEQKMYDNCPASLSDMKATAAWMAACGVTDFTLYYDLKDRTEDEYKQYCDFVGRINYILKDAIPLRKTLLYYPIFDLWGEYKPVADKLTIESQSEKSQRIISSFMNSGRLLQKSQIPFVIIDHDFLGECVINSNGELQIGKNEFNSIIIPENVILPPKANYILGEFKKQNGKIITFNPELIAEYPVCEILQLEYRLSPPDENITLGIFQRGSNKVLLIVNTSQNQYSGSLLTKNIERWIIMNPENGNTLPSNSESSGNMELKLYPKEALILMSK